MLVFKIVLHPVAVVASGVGKWVRKETEEEKLTFHLFWKYDLDK